MSSPREIHEENTSTVWFSVDVKDQNWDVALFQEMASTPATLEAAKYCDFFGTLQEDHATEGRAVEQEYLQATLEGPPTWIVLPKEIWTPEMHKMKMPVVRLEKALYGHKNSGAFRQNYCNEVRKKAGFELFSENWPCVFITVYVVDLKIAGPRKNFAEAWELLGANMTLAQPTGDTTEISNYLGTEHIRGQTEINGKKVQTMALNVSHSMKHAISIYEEQVYQIVGRFPRMCIAKTPFQPEETKFADARAPAHDGLFWECPSCLDTFPVAEMQEKYCFSAGTKRLVKSVRSILENPKFDIDG